MTKRFFAVVVLAALLTSLLPSMAFAAGCDGANIIFSEIDYDQPGTDNAEFIELRILNATTISNCELRLINGATPNSPVEYRTIDISGTYAANKYLVIGSTGVSSRDITIGGSCATDCIQNGNNDGFALVDTPGSGSLVWFLSYEGQITNYNPGDSSLNSSTNLPVSEDNNSPNKSIHNGPDAGVSDSYLGDANPGNPGPNAITLRAMNASSGPGALPVAGIAMLGLAGAALWRRRR